MVEIGGEYMGVDEYLRNRGDNDDDAGEFRRATSPAAVARLAAAVPARIQAAGPDDTARKKPVHPETWQSRLRQVAMGPAEGSFCDDAGRHCGRAQGCQGQPRGRRAGDEAHVADPEIPGGEGGARGRLGSDRALGGGRKAPEQVALQAKADHERRQLEDAQAGAQDAQERARTIVAQIVPLIEGLAVQVLELQQLSGLVNRGTHFEQYAVRERMIDRQTIMSGVGVDGQLAVRLLRVARELVKLSPVTMQVAEHRAIQGKLE